jgi:TolA-binding protein
MGRTSITRFSIVSLALMGLSTAWAQPAVNGLQVEDPSPEATSDDADFRIRVGERATIQRLPRANGRIVEIYARNIDPRVDLGALFRGNTARIQLMDAVEKGGGVWLLRATLRDPPGGGFVDLDVRKEGDEFVFDVVPAKAPITRGREAAPTLAQLIAGEIPEANPENPAASVFKLLPGDAISQRMEAWEYEYSLTRSPPTVLAASWERIDAARRRMLQAWPGTSVHQEYMYYLGYYYLAKGFGREARYYFSQMSARPGTIPQSDIALERARAELACSNFDVARQWFEEAYSLGGDHDSILEGLAVVSLETGDPARAPTARLIWKTTSASGPMMLAAELLQIDGRMAESRDILESIIPDTLPEAARQRRALRLGDARFYDRYEGNVEGAALAWDDAAPDMSRSRDLFLELHQTGTDPQKWTQLIPALVQASMQRSDAGAEALYLLFQIDASVGSREDAINDLAIILRRYPQKATGSDVPERFWRVYSDYVSDLADAGRHFEIAALHESVWSSTVKRAVRTPEVLVDVARAYAHVGLPQQAVTVMRDASQVLFEEGSDDHALLYQLAELYAAVGEGVERLPAQAPVPRDPDLPREQTTSPFGTPQDEVWAAGLDTLKYLRGRNAGQIPAARIELLEARMHVGRADFDAANDALRRASKDPVYRDVAMLRLALIEAGRGRCSRALPILRRLGADPDAAALLNDSRPWLALARCEIAIGAPARGAQAARRAAEVARLRLDSLSGAEEDGLTDAEEVRLDVPEEAQAPEKKQPALRALDPMSLDPDAGELADIANARTTVLRGELKDILQAEIQYAMGLAAIAEGWTDDALIEKLQDRGGIWSAMAQDYKDDEAFDAAVDVRGTIPWDGL